MDVDHARIALAHGRQHPHDVVAVGLERVGEVEAATTALRARDDEQVREALAVQAEEGLRAFLLPLPLQRAAVAPGDHVERGGRHPLEAGGVDQHVERVLHAVVHHAALVDLAHADGRGVHEVHVRQVERGQVLVVEGRALAAVGVEGLQRRCRLRVLHDRVHARANLLHDAEVGVELLVQQLLHRQRALVLLALLELGDLAGEVVVVGLDGGAAGRDLREARAPCPRPTGLVGPGLDLLLRGGALVAHVHRRRRALEHVQLAHDLRELRDHLHGGGAGADDAHALALQVDMVVPARGVEGLALELAHALDARELGRGEDAVRQDHEARAHRIAAVGLHGPAAARLVPGRLLHRGVEQAVLVEAELLGHLLAVLEDLEARGELHGGHVAHLLQHREVAVRLDVAGDAGIAVPVPGAADVAALLAEAHVGEARGAQLVPQQQAGEAGTHHEDLALVVERVALHRVGGVDVREVLREVAFHRHVVRGAAPCFLELAVLRLLLGIEGGARRQLGQRLQRLVADDRVALALDAIGGLRGAGVEQLAAGGGIDADRRVLGRGIGHGRVPGFGWMRWGRGRARCAAQCSRTRATLSDGSGWEEVVFRDGITGAQEDSGCAKGVGILL